MTVVVDASVAAKWFIQEPETSFADALRAQGSVIAPDLIIAEVMNVVWKNNRLGRFSLDQARRVAGTLGSAFTELIPCTRLTQDALKIAIALDHPIYDAFYIAGAELADVELITADGTLLRKIRGTKFAKRVRPLVP